MQNSTKMLGEAPVGSLLFKLALPAIIAQIVNLLYNVVDRIFIGNIPLIGQAALTGVGVCVPLIFLISAFAAFVSMGGAPRASIALGRGDREEAERILANCFFATVLLSAVLTVIFAVFAEPILLMFGASENTVGYAVSYMRVYALGTVFVQVTLGMNAFITAQGFARISMLTVIIGALINLALDPLFIFVLDMGVQGAALATIISQAASAIWVVMFLLGRNTTLRLKTRYMSLKGKIIFPCLALGLSPFIMQSTESILAVCFNTSLLKYGGDVAVCTMTVLTSVWQFASMPLHGLTQGAQPIISYNYGAGNAERCKGAFKLLLISCLCVASVICLLAELFPQTFISMFNSDPELIEFAIPALRIYIAACGIFGAQIACQQTFIAIGNAKTSLFLALLRKVFLLIPLIYILPELLADKTSAVFLAEPIADTLAVATTVILFGLQFSKAMKRMESAK